MKGIIYNAVEDAVERLYSADTWDLLLEKAGLEGDYTALGSYDDDQLNKLVAAGCELTGMEPNNLIRTLGRHAFPYLADRYPELVAEAEGTYDLLRIVNQIIHPEVLKLHPDASPPEFDYVEQPSGAVRVTYRSVRKLGVLAEGLICGAGDRYNEDIQIDVVDGQGEAVCVFDVTATACTPVG